METENKTSNQSGSGLESSACSARGVVLEYQGLYFSGIRENGDFGMTTIRYYAKVFDNEFSAAVAMAKHEELRKFRRVWAGL